MPSRPASPSSCTRAVRSTKFVAAVASGSFSNVADDAALLDHEPARGIVRRLLHRDRRGEREVREGARRLDAGGRAGGRRGWRHSAAVTAATAGCEREGEAGRPDQVAIHRGFLACPDSSDRSDGAQFLRGRLQRAVVLSKAEADEPCRRRLVAEGRQRNGRDAVPARQFLAEAGVGQVGDRGIVGELEIGPMDGPQRESASPRAASQSESRRAW